MYVSRVVDGYYQYYSPRILNFMYNQHVPFNTLQGKTISEITTLTSDRGVVGLTITCTDSTRYKLEHTQDCCEQVTLEDICGELDDLIGVPLLQAEEIRSRNGDNTKIAEALTHYLHPTKSHDDSFTWTFYRLATTKGSVVLRWYGESNGYYSESVDLTLLGDEE